jgi:predicted aspartyl protease
MIAIRKVLGALGVALLLVGAPACSYGRSEAAFAKGASAPMPFEFFRETRIVLPVQVNGHPVEALLDSGAGIVVLDKAYAAEIGVVPTGSISVNGMTVGGQAPTASGVTISVGGLTLKNVQVVIADLASVAAGIGRPLPIILGREAFTAAIVDIDFPARRIAFHDPAAFHAPPGAIRLPLTDTPDRLHELPMSVEGGAAEPTNFDLGSSTPVYVSRDYADRHRFLQTHATVETLAGGYGGSSVHDATMLKSIRLGEVELTNVPALVNRSAVESPTRGFNVGMPVLSRFRLMIDFGHGGLFLIPNAAALAQPFAKDRTGMTTRLAGDHLDIAFVTPGGPAAQAGWKVGEKITAVDGEPIGPKFYTGAHAQWQMAPAGATVEVTLDGGAKRRLTLKDYY